LIFSFERYLVDFIRFIPIEKIEENENQRKSKQFYVSSRKQKGFCKYPKRIAYKAARSHSTFRKKTTILYPNIAEIGWPG